MRIIPIVIIGTALFYFSCAGMNKHMSESIIPATESTAPEIEAKQKSVPEPEIKEVEETLVPIDTKLPDPHSYFVVIGSFKILDNAKKYQEQILIKGFRSEILKNEAGLFRVSVMSTNEIKTAREEIRRIRGYFPEYSDTWLLIQKK